jgi:hypothetical protein
MSEKDLLDSLDKLSNHNRMRLIACLNLTRVRHADGIWGGVPVNLADKPWKIRIMKMIHDLCWFYDRMEGHSENLLVKEFNQMVKRMNERDL